MCCSNKKCTGDGFCSCSCMKCRGSAKKDSCGKCSPDNTWKEGIDGGNYEEAPEYGTGIFEEPKVDKFLYNRNKVSTQEPKGTISEFNSVI